MANVVYLTRERMAELEKELHELKTEGRKKIAETIAEARAHGDLSENAEYDAAKEKQGLFEMKISKLEELLSRAQLIDTSAMSNDKVHILAKVKVKNHNTGQELEYTLVSPEEADLKAGKIAVTSPVGKALIGKAVGEITQATVPAGIIKFEILSIE